jgi:hypothetical protein
VDLNRADAFQPAKSIHCTDTTTAAATAKAISISSTNTVGYQGERDYCRSFYINYHIINHHIRLDWVADSSSPLKRAAR